MIDPHIIYYLYGAATKCFSVRNLNRAAREGRYQSEVKHSHLKPNFRTSPIWHSTLASLYQEQQSCCLLGSRYSESRHSHIHKSILTSPRLLHTQPTTAPSGRMIIYRALRLDIHPFTLSMNWQPITGICTKPV